MPTSPHIQRLREAVGNDLAVVFQCEIVGGTLETRDGEATGFRWCAGDELAALGLPYPPETFAAAAEQTPVFDP